MSKYIGTKKERNAQAVAKYQKTHKEKINEKVKKYTEENPEKVKEYQRKTSLRTSRRKIDNIRSMTRSRNGKLKTGFEYHHTKPYNSENFIILEKDFHKFFHSNSKQFNMRGRLL